MTSAMIRLDNGTEVKINELSKKWKMAKFEVIEKIIKSWLEQQK
jgi:predicted transcriptional regulator